MSSAGISIRTEMFFILVDLLLPISTTRAVRSEINQHASSAAAAMEASSRRGSPAQDLTQLKSLVILQLTLATLAYHSHNFFVYHL